MSIFEALLSGLTQATSLEVIPYVIVGALFGLAMGVIPGLGGHFAMAMAIPFLYSMSPAAGIAFLLGSHSTVAQGGGLTAILFDTPGAGQNAATLLDGPAMRNKGLAGKACGAAMVSCFLGALFGVLVLALLLPVLQQLVIIIGPAEICMLVFLALTFVVVLSKESLIRGLIAGLAGLLLSMVGLDIISNEERFTFGLLPLRDGLPMVPVILGLFAVAEMMNLWVQENKDIESQTTKLSAKNMQKQIFGGALEAIKNWWLVMRCSAIGTVMGLIPGLGSTAAAFVAYGHAKQTSKSADTFGQGNIEGIIGPESANDAVEGGALAATIAFGIPGSSSMAIVLAGLFVLGLHTGPEMVTKNTDLVFVMIFTIIIGNLVGTITGLFLVNPLSRLTTLPANLLVPVLITVIFTGAYAVNRSIFDIGIVVFFGFIGYAMRHLQFSRSALLIGFVLGTVLESNFYLAVQLESPLFFLNPAPLAILAVAAIFLLGNVRSFRKNATHRRKGGHSEPAGLSAGSATKIKRNPNIDSTMDLVFVLSTGVWFTGMLLATFRYSFASSITPVLILLPLLALTGFQVFRIRRNRKEAIKHNTSSIQPDRSVRAVRFALWLILLALLITIFGHYAGISVFLYMLLNENTEKNRLRALTITTCVTLGMFALFEIGFQIELNRGLFYKALAGFQLF